MIEVATPLGLGMLGEEFRAIILPNGDMIFQVKNSKGKIEKIELLEDHLSDIIHTLTELKKKLAH